VYYKCAISEGLALAMVFASGVEGEACCGAVCGLTPMVWPDAQKRIDSMTAHRVY
jgi:hypothetical protein